MTGINFHLFLFLIENIFVSYTKVFIKSRKSLTLGIVFDLTWNNHTRICWHYSKQKNFYQEANSIKFWKRWKKKWIFKEHALISVKYIKSIKSLKVILKSWSPCVVIWNSQELKKNTENAFNWNSIDTITNTTFFSSYL